MAAGSWLLAEELFNRGQPGFADELRRVHYAERLAAFPEKWLADPRPFARAALFDYLSRLLNCYRHEPLVKRLFKLAEKNGDDELMGAFLVAFDRTVRRARRTRTRSRSETFRTHEEAEAAIRRWAEDGYGNGQTYQWSGRTHAYAWKSEEAVVAPGNTVMPRPGERDLKKNITLGDWERGRLERRFLLFSMPTRRYLRRRAWRYFRLLGKASPERYVEAAAKFLVRYTDADADSDIHLLDNWGLTHTLFSDSPALRRPAKGWEFAPNCSLADLAPAPRYEAAWAAAPRAVFDVLLGAKCRAVRQSAVWMLRKHHEGWLAGQGVATFLRLADHADPDLSALGFDLLEKSPDLASVPVEEWLKRLDGDDLTKLQRLAAILKERLDPARVDFADMLKLAAYRSKPVAELGFALLQRSPAAVDPASLLPLVQAECEAVRPELAAWVRRKLEASGPLRGEWITEYLDSKHADVRAAGWAWLNESPLKDDPAVWHRLIESPYDDIRGPLVAALADRAEGADLGTVRLLWATVLLNVARGGRHKPGVVARVVARLLEHPDEADDLLKLLAVAVRSLRGPEFRTGLAGVVALVEHKPDLLPAVRARFPELEM